MPFHIPQFILITFLLVLSVFMVLLILIQRGKGGGLAGAFGGMGGQSAFGTKAGDVFTKITVVVAVLWFVLCCVTILSLNAEYASELNIDQRRGRTSAPVQGTPDASTDGETPAAPGAGAPTSTVPATTVPATTVPTPPTGGPTAPAE